MNESRRTIAYFILVLLILLVVAIIGGLSAVLFNMKPPVPQRPNVVVAAPAPDTNTTERITPVAEMRVEIPPEELPKPPVDEEKAGSGVIPTICDGYGPQIQERKAYWGPVTHDVNVRPNRVTLRLNIDDSSEGPNNIR